MKIIKYQIKNYRAISSTEIKLNYSINPIIGVNESGKTTILQALLAFDKNRDKYNGGIHLEYQNKYSTSDTQNSTITAFIKLDKKELSEIKAITGSNRLKDEHEFKLMRDLSHLHRSYKLIDNNIPEIHRNKIKEYIVDNLPFILYFDDFTDRVPDEIAFSEEFLNTSKLHNNRNKDWQEILIEIFKRAQSEKEEKDQNQLQYFLKLKDVDRKQDFLSDIEDVLNNEIIEEWKKVKKSGATNFADDSDNLSLELKNEDNTFKFKVRDKSNQDKKRTFNVSERSKGFQWFFNYMIKLKFNPRYKKIKENSIFLLDEPGSYLHSSAQSELLNELSRVSKSNIIVYCTHSQYLLNPKIIRLGSIKIAEKRKAEITLTEYGSYKGKNDKGALSALYQALQLNFSRDFLGKLAITEGITDLYFFEMLQKHTSLLPSNVRFIAGAGAGNSSNLISLGVSFSENFVVLFDNDDGLKAIKKYIIEFGDDILKKFHKYSDEDRFRLESFLSKSDKEKIRKITGIKDLKKSFSILYYDMKDSQADFFSSLDSETIKKLEGTITRIKEI